MLTGPPPKFHGTRDILLKRPIARSFSRLRTMRLAIAMTELNPFELASLSGG